MKDNPHDADSPIWTAEDFAQARPADTVLPPHLARLLTRELTGLRAAVAGQPVLARGLKLAA